MDVLFYKNEDQSNLNFRLERVLRSYVSTPDPNYAILLNASWGSGKTTWVKGFLANINPDQKKHVYVSLFGLNSRAEIENELMQALHPLMFSKAGRLAGKLATAAMKFYKVDANITLSDITDALNSDIFVFDDLERCEMPLTSALGYINQFIEHGNRHVIILCDEKQIEKDEEKHKQYKIRKEKIVGRTIGLISPTKDALQSFINGQEDSFSKEFLGNMSSKLEEVFNDSNCNNLRVLRQIIVILGQFIDVLNRDWQIKTEGLTHVCLLIQALGIEILLGKISKEDLFSRTSRFGRELMRQINKDDKPKTIFELLQERHPGLDLSDSIISNKTLSDIIFDGFVDGEIINVELSKSPRFAGYETEASWVTVWHFTERPEDTVLKAIDDMIAKFERGEYKQRGVVLHVFGLLLNLSQAGQLKMNYAQTLERGKWYIDTYRATLESMPSLDRGPLYNTSYGGLGFACEEMSEYKEFRAYFDRVSVEEFEASLPQEADRLMDQMVNNTEEFEREINHHAGGISRFASIPVLAYLDASVFTNSFLKLDPSNQRSILVQLHIRYNYNNLSRDLAKELDWAISFREELLKRTKAMPAISALRIRQILSWTLEDISEIKTRLKIQKAGQD